MELRSTRSRSKSRPRASIGEYVENSENHKEMGRASVRTTRSTTVKLTVSSNSDNITNIDHNLDVQSARPVKMKDEKSIRKSRYKTSDYSSQEEGEDQVSSTYNMEQNSKNHVMENMRRSVSRSTGSHVSALDFYRAAGEYWNKFPKTDYTYSLHSKDRTEIAPGVVAMPNMSRRSLHEFDSDVDYITAHKQTNTESFLQEEVDYSSNSYNSRLTSNINSDNFTKLRGRNLFSNNNSEDKYYSVSSRTSYLKKESIARRIFTVFTSIFITSFTWISSLCLYVYKSQNSAFLWLAKKIHKASTHIMLWDTWLLQSSTTKKKLSSLLALCLVPLILLGGWWLLSGLGPLLYGKYLNSSSSKIVTTNMDINNNINYKDQDYQYDSIIQVNSIGKDVPNTQTKTEERVITIKEKVILEPPNANEIAAELTPAQLQVIANSITLNIENQYDDKTITKILENPRISEILNNYDKLMLKLEDNKSKNDENLVLADTESQHTIIDSLREEINKVRLQLHHLEKSHNEEITNVIAQLQAENAKNNARLTYLLNRCCRHSLIHMENYIARILKNFLGAPQYLSTQKDISDWLRATFVAKHDLEMHLANVTDHLKTHYDTLIENSSKMIMDEVMSKISAELLTRIENAQHQNHLHVKEVKIDTLTDQRIKEIVRDALALYDADKTGLVDYALESAGGQVISTRCTDSYQARTAVISILGIPLWYPTNTPRTVITPGMTPGECWAFQNFPGFLVIKLATPIKIEAFSLEHISKMLAPDGRIDSAPKEFSVYGLKNETDNDPLLLGKYVYSYEGTPLQYFAAEVYKLVFDLIELRIHSNHGNPNYTCLYRFRVHGSLNTEPT